MRIRLVLPLAAALLLPCFPASSARAGDAAEGRKVYDAWCAGCHGANGDGAGPMAGGMHPPPRDFTAGVFLYARSDEDLFRFITEGRPPMPSWAGLPEKDRRDVVAYIRTLKGKPAEEGSEEEGSAEAGPGGGCPGMGPHGGGGPHHGRRGHGGMHAGGPGGPRSGGGGPCGCR